jgi:hypothetical protein
MKKGVGNLKRIALSIIILALLSGCNRSVEEDAYLTNQVLIKSKFPVPESLEFPDFEKHNVLCEEDMCSVKGTVRYENKYGVEVEGDYESILTFDEDYFYLESVNINER